MKDPLHILEKKEKMIVFWTSEKIKAINSQEKERNFEPHHSTTLEKTMTDIESGSIIKTVDERLKSTNR